MKRKTKKEIDKEIELMEKIANAIMVEDRKLLEELAKH